LTQFQRKEKVMRARVDPEVCIGAAACIAIAPEVFELGGDGLAQVIDDKDREAEEDLLREAAEGCPVQAIILEDDEGNQIYP
jgi:ferredoxin